MLKDITIYQDVQTRCPGIIFKFSSPTHILPIITFFRVYHSISQILFQRISLLTPTHACTCKTFHFDCLLWHLHLSICSEKLISVVTESQPKENLGKIYQQKIRKMDHLPGDFTANFNFLSLSLSNCRQYGEIILTYKKCVYLISHLLLCMHAKLLLLCPTLCKSMDCSLPGSSVHGIPQARIMEWVTVPSSRGSSQPRDRASVSGVSCIAGGFFFFFLIFNVQHISIIIIIIHRF